MIFIGSGAWEFVGVRSKRLDYLPAAQSSSMTHPLEALERIELVDSPTGRNKKAICFALAAWPVKLTASEQVACGPPRAALVLYDDFRKLAAFPSGSGSIASTAGLVRGP
jgi:hypothetical protein